jgi:hypothetical protein
MSIHFVSTAQATHYLQRMSRYIASSTIALADLAMAI